MILGPMCGTVMLNNTVKETTDQNDKPTIYGATFNRNFDGFVKIVGSQIFFNKFLKLFRFNMRTKMIHLG